TSSPSTGTTLATTQGDEFIFAAFGYENTGAFTPVAGASPFYAEAGSEVNSGTGNPKDGHMSIGAAYRIVSATGTQTATATTANSADYAAAIVTYRVAAFVTSASSTAANAAYTIGAVIPVTVTFNVPM